MGRIILRDSDTLFDQWAVEEEVLRQIVGDIGTRCLLWTGNCNPAGYGRINSRDLIERIAALGGFASTLDTILVHRYMFWSRYGWLPDGVLDHKESRCNGRRRNCCNPEHLEPVTPVLNTLRGVYSRYQPGETHGTLFDPEEFEVGVIRREW